MKHSIYHWFNRHRNPELKQDWRETDFLVVDTELTSMDVKKASMLSIAWIGINRQRIQLNQAQHRIHKTDADLQQSPAIHGLTADKIAQGENLKTILSDLIVNLENSVLVCHHAGLDVPILRRLCQENDLSWPNPVILDTLQIDRYLIQKGSEIPPQNSLTLGACRARYNLPSSQNHDALSDAQATAELFLAQCHRLSAGHPYTIQDLRQVS